MRMPMRPQTPVSLPVRASATTPGPAARFADFFLTRRFSGLDFEMSQSRRLRWLLLSSALAGVGALSPNEALAACGPTDPFCAQQNGDIPSSFGGPPLLRDRKSTRLNSSH